MKRPTASPRRFYKAVDTQPGEGGVAVRLDARTPRSPGGRLLVAPTQALADLLAEEWRRQGEHIRMADMPAVRLAYTALDAIPAARRETADEVAAYAASDALCYRAQHPQVLVRRQQAGWDPLLAWAETELGVALTATAGVVHQPQPAQALDRVRELAETQNDFQLAGLAFATALFGSAVLGLAVQFGRLGGDEAFDLSRLDETFQEEQWGVDAEAAQRTARLRREAEMVGAWFAALR
jgi:chaperone required for assembly of F1-ATPase